jgi:serine/threonine protein phosphatase PrpC
MSPNNGNDSAFLIGSFTDPGRSGKNNEDALAVFEVDWQDSLRLRRVQVAVVADGIGGNNAGEVASRIAVEKIGAVLRTQATVPIVERLQQALQQANHEIFDTGQSNPTLAGMGSTVVAAAIVDDLLHVAHVGDSRAYLVRDGVAYRLTLDHTWAQEAIEIGRLSPEAARSHPNRNVIKRYLGVDEALDVDHKIIDIEQTSSEIEGPGRWPMAGQMRLLPGDTVLLCSDGLTDELTDAELQGAVRKYEPQAAAEQLTAMANAHGGRDNITVVLLRVPGGAPVPTAKAPAAAAAGGKSRLPLLVAAILGVLLLAALAALLLSRRGSDDAATAVPEPPAVAVVDTTVAEGVAPMDALLATPAETPAGMASATPTIAVLAPTASGVLPGTAAAAGGGGISTPLPTRTPTPVLPTSTPPSARTTSAGATTTASARTSPAAAGNLTVALQEPNDGDTCEGEVTFRWSVTGGSLAPGQSFEVFFYRPGEDPLTGGFGLAAPTSGNAATVDLAGLDAAAGHPLEPGSYLWSVRLVQGGRPLRVLADGRRLVYQRPAQQQQQPPSVPPTAEPTPTPTLIP